MGYSVAVRLGVTRRDRGDAHAAQAICSSLWKAVSFADAGYIRIRLRAHVSALRAFGWAWRALVDCLGLRT